MTPRDVHKRWSISFDYPPIPIRDADWSATHPNFDGFDDNRYVQAATREALIEAIDEWIAENEPDTNSPTDLSVVGNSGGCHVDRSASAPFEPTESNIGGGRACVGADTSADASVEPAASTIAVATPIQPIPAQVRGALIGLGMDTRCNEAERACLRALAEIGSEHMLIRLRAMLR